MEFFDSLTQAFHMILNWQVPLWTIAGLSIGIVLGSIPGVSGVLAITLLLGPSYYMTPINAIIFLTAIYTGSIFGGGISAILLNIPGTPAAIATGFDGYALTRKGRHNEALGASIISSAIGCFVSYAVVLLLFPVLGIIVLNFGPAEMLMVVIFAIISIGVVKGEIVQTSMLGLFGILIGTVGSSAFGNARGTFDIDALYEGLPLIPALLGLLAVSELLFMVERTHVVDQGEESKQDLSQIVKGMFAALKHPRTLIRSSLVGVGIGLLPAAGSTISAMISYGMEKKRSKTPEKFGKGEISGLVAAETANNASEGGAVATMMLLGIPGSATTALLIAAFMIHGMSPGPFLVRDNLDFAYAVILIQFLQAAGLVVIGTLFVNYFARLIYLPVRILLPGVLIFSVVGALAPRSLMLDVVVMLIFAALGYIMKKLDYPIMGFILGLVLASLVDMEFVRTLLLFGDEPAELLKRPAFLVLVAITLGFVVWPHIWTMVRGKKTQPVQH